MIGVLVGRGDVSFDPLDGLAAEPGKRLPVGNLRSYTPSELGAKRRGRDGSAAAKDSGQLDRRLAHPFIPAKTILLGSSSSTLMFVTGAPMNNSS